MRDIKYNFDTNSYNSTNTHTDSNTHTCLIEEANERNKIKALRCKSHEIFMFPFRRWNFYNFPCDILAVLLVSLRDAIP
jgi:hypothetical protein